MVEKKEAGPNIGRTAVAVAVAAGFVLVVIFGLICSGTYEGQTLLKAARGELSFDAAVTRVILERRMAAYGVPEADRRRLDEVLVGIPDRLEGSAEVDLRELAHLILDAGADGDITEVELAEISVFIEERTK